MTITPDGFVRPTYAEIRDSIAADMRAKISQELILDETTVEGNLISIVAERISLVWEALDYAYHARDPRSAMGDALVGLALVTGCVRKQPTKGTVICSVGISGSRYYAPGDLVARRITRPDQTWTNRDAITTSGSGWVSAVFESTFTGSDATVETDGLEIAQSVTGWNSVESETCTPGTDLEPIEVLRQRREFELTISGASHIQAIAAAVRAMPTITDAAGEENTTDYPVNGIAPHGFRITAVGAATNDEIAQVIAENRAAGVPSSGALTGTATIEGISETVRFSRATPLVTAVSVAVVASPATTVARVTEAITLAFTGLRIGQDVSIGQVIRRVLEVPEISDCTVLLQGASTNRTVGTDEIGTLGTVTVTGDV